MTEESEPTARRWMPTAPTVGRAARARGGNRRRRRNGCRCPDGSREHRGGRPRPRGPQPVVVRPQRFFRHRLAVVGLIGLIIIFGAGIFANLVAPYSYFAIDLNNILHPPTTIDHHYFGTDGIGSDEFSRVIFGIRTSREVGVFVAVVSSIVGLIVGAVAGYFGGILDNLLMRITDLVLTLAGARDPADRLGADPQHGPVEHLDHPCRLLLDGHRPRRARRLPLVAREGVRGGGEGVGSRRRSDHVPAHPPEHPRAGHRQRDARGRHGDPDRGDALVPRLRHRAADPVARPARRERRRTIPCSGG